jgi:hypothetical protein
VVQAHGVAPERAVETAAQRSAGRWFAPALSGVLFSIYALMLILIQTRSVSAEPMRLTDIVLTASFVGWGVLGSLIISRRPEHTEGWLLVAAGTVTVLTLVCETFGAGASNAEVPRFLGWLGAWIAEASVPVLVVLLIIYFPQGRLRTRLERATACLTIVMGSLTAASIALAPGRVYGHDFRNPYGIQGLESASEAIKAVLVDGPLLAVAFLLALVTLGIRAKRSRGEERQQIKWFVYSVITVALFVIPGSLASTLDLSSATTELIISFFAVAIAAVPAAITVALLRYRLYDIDLIINRTLVYVALTTVLAGAYIASVFVLQGLLSPITRESDLVVAASTLAVAALFRPARQRVQSFIDRRFYRHPYDAALVISDFSARIRNEVELNAVAGQLETAVRDSMQPSSVSVWTVPPVSKR